MKQNTFNFYQNSKTETNTNDTGNDSVFESICNTIIIEQTISISKFKHLSGTNYIKLPKEFNHFKKRCN